MNSTNEVNSTIETQNSFCKQYTIQYNTKLFKCQLECIIIQTITIIISHGTFYNLDFVCSQPVHRGLWGTATLYLTVCQTYPYFAPPCGSQTSNMHNPQVNCKNITLPIMTNKYGTCTLEKKMAPL